MKNSAWILAACFASSVFLAGCDNPRESEPKKDEKEKAREVFGGQRPLPPGYDK